MHLQESPETKLMFFSEVIIYELIESQESNESYLTCPATARPSARRDTANQTCRQTWNAAMDVDPWCAANDAASVTQNVTAMTLMNNRKPAQQ